ncbi:MAG: hypothetical protein ACYTG7_15985 [Planctomycetota bacterium]
MEQLKIITLITGIIVTGEALILFLGMRVFIEKENPWVCVKNDVLMALDALLGGAMIYLALAGEGPESGRFIAVIILALATLLHREWEYLVQRKNPYCKNIPLFVVNCIKLAGLFLVVAESVWSILTGRS